MSAKAEKPAPKGRRNEKKGQPKPSIIKRMWRLAVEHPRGVLIGAATLLGLIVVLENWRNTEAKLLIWTIKLPFILWALIFMLVGYFTGKWIEWAIQQRRIRKGTYKPRHTAEELADASADLEGRLDNGESAADDEEEPATIIDRGEHKPKPAHAGSDGPVEQVDYWEEPAAKQKDGEDKSGKFSPAARGAGGEGGGRSRDEREERGGYREYRDYGDSGGGGRYSDFSDAEGGRYSDYSDAEGGRYSDYQDSGGGRYGDYQDSGGGRRGDYGDYQDSGGGQRGGRRR